MTNTIFQNNEQQAAALDTESNVAARVLTIYPRYLRIGNDKVFGERYGKETLQKAQDLSKI